MGRDAALGAGAVGAGTAAHHHHESAQRDNHAPETGRSFPLGGNSNSGTGSSYPSGQTGTYPAAGSTTAGPHSSNLANKADPRVDSDLDGSRATRQTGYGSGTGASPSSAHQGSLGRDAAIGAGTGAAIGGASSGVSGYGPENWEYKHGRHGHQYEGDPCGPGETAGAGPHFVSGPHTTDTANRLDPHVAGGVGGTQTATGHHGQHGHRAEEAGLAGGATGAGLGAYEGSRDHAGTATGRSTEPGLGSSNAGTVDSTTGPAPKTAGPHKSDMLNKLDPRVDSDRSKQQGSSGTTGSGLGSSTTGTSDPYSSQSSGHHRGEEAAIGGAGLAGAAAYEGNKHHDHKEPNVPGSTSGTSSSTNPYSSSAVDPRVSGGHVGSSNTTTTGLGKDHYLGRDAGLGAGAGGLAYEAERHHGQPTQSHNIPSDTTGNAYDGDRGPSGYDQAGSRMAGSSQQPATTKDHHYGRDAALGAGAGGLAYEAEKHHGRDHSGLASTPQDQLAGSGHQPRAAGTTMDHSQHTGRDNHVGRDAAVGGAGLGAGAAGIDEHKKFQETGRMDPGAVVREHRHPGDPVATYPSAGYGNERSHHDSGHHGHRKEEEALVGGAAAGGLAHHELSKKDEKALEKEHSKEMKQHDKEFAKEEKVHDKDLKAHEKERAKHMAAIEKDQKKHEHDGEKKKGGGLLGFLHREKPDKELKEDEAHRQASLNASQYRGDEARSTGAGTDSYADPLAAQHGSQSGVHDTPTGTGSTIHDAYGTQEGHNKLHKDPPAHVRGQDYQGHSNVS